MKKKRSEINGLPTDFVDRLQLQFPNHFQDILDSFHQRRPVVRINTLLITVAEFQKQMHANGVHLLAIPLLCSSFIADVDRRTLTDLDQYKSGLFYIQSMASQLVVKALDPQPGEKILDLCAAPGSKTTQIAIAMDARGELLANDNNKPRFFRLLSNLRHQHLSDFVQTKNYSGQNYPKFYPEYFDRVLADVPCSSESRFDLRYPKSIRYWSRHKVKSFAKLGRRLLDAAVRCCKPGGIIVFSTCTFSPAENELVVDFALRKHPELKVDDISWKIKKLPIMSSWKEKEISSDLSRAIRTYPSGELEGFFICRLQKKK